MILLAIRNSDFFGNSGVDKLMMNRHISWVTDVGSNNPGEDSPMANKFNPTPQQTAIFEAVASGVNLVIQARAGTGKTTTILEAIDHIPANKQISVLAFNRKIAAEISEKLKGRGIDWKRCNASTVHAAGYRAWKRVVGDKLKTDGSKVKNLIVAAWEANHLFGIHRDDLSTIQKLISLAKNAGFGALQPIDSSDGWWELVDHFALESDLNEKTRVDDVIAAAQMILKQSLDLDRQVIDFDDMLLAPLVHNVRMYQVDVVMIDEAQDTNAARRALARKMVKPNGQTIAVGDDRQAIYGFTGADADALQLIDDSVGGASWLPLSKTFRCGKAIVGEAVTIVPDYEAADSNDDGQVVGLTGLDNLLKAELSPNDAILCRYNAPLLKMAYTLISKGVSVRVEGRDIGKGLVKLARRWKVKKTKTLVERLDVYCDRELQRWQAKDQPEKAQAVVDKVESLKAVISWLDESATVDQLVAEIENLFGDSSSDPRNVLTLSSIHKSKGLEWHRVFLLDPAKSPRPRREWQAVQESNLIYVAITRAMDTLVYLNCPEVIGEAA